MTETTMTGRTVTEKTITRNDDRGRFADGTERRDGRPSRGLGLAPLCVAILVGGLALSPSAAKAQNEDARQAGAEARLNAYGDQWQAYEVKSTVDVRDFHVCIEKPNRMLRPAEILAALDLGHKDAAGREVDYPEGWQVSVDDSYPGHWCINYTPGPGARPLNGEGTFKLRFRRGQQVFDAMHSRSAQLLVTRTPANRRVRWNDDVLFKTGGLVRGPRFTVSQERADGRQPAPGADGERQADLGGSADESWAPAGSRLVLTGTVVADQPAFLSVVGPAGVTLGGVVVEVDGERRVTDGNGQVVIPAVTAAAGGAMLARLATADGAVETARAAVVPPSSGGLSQPPASAPPTVTEVPPFPTRDAPVTIRGAGFGGDPEDLGVRLGDTHAGVLSASPTELVAQLPADAPLGPQALTVTTTMGDSAPATVTLVALRLTSTDTTIARGRKGQATVHVEGTEEALRLGVTGSGAIALAGGPTQVVTTSGGADNRAEIAYRGVSPGTFQITATVLNERPEKP